MTRVAICICTYKRPDGLTKLLDKLTQLTPATPDAVVVIDNHKDGEGAAVCSRLAASYPFELHYAIEAEPGISYARNSAVSLALQQQADLIAFLDDDEWPEPNWLTELIRVQTDTDADAVGGPTLSVFPPNSPESLTSNPYYGADMSIEDGSRCHLQAAGNFIIRASTISDMGPAFFRTEFAHSGGEDLAFFLTLTQKGARMAWAANAVVHEAVPANRMSRDWLKGRIINIANSRVRVMQILEPGIVPAAIRGLKTVALFFQATVWSLIGLLNVTRREHAAMLRWKFLGKFTAHIRHKTVREEGH
ncbi:MAG: glycosyltransferase family 2 protein [Granulosicoccaceae bacterium]